MRLVASTLLIGTLLAGSFATGARAAALSLCFEDAVQAPWTMPDGTGLNFELLRRVEKLTGERFNIVSRPWKRCMEETRTGSIDGMIGAADSPERRAFSLPPMRSDGTPDAERAMYEDRVDLYLRVGSGASWDGRELRNPQGIVVAQRGYFVVDMLRARGQRVHDTIKSAEEGLRLLAAGTADVAVLLGRPAEDMVRDEPRFHGKIVIAKEPFVTFPFYLMFARTSYAHDPQRIEAIWNAIAQVRATADYLKLEANAGRRHE